MNWPRLCIVLPADDCCHHCSHALTVNFTPSQLVLDVCQGKPQQAGEKSGGMRGAGFWVWAPAAVRPKHWSLKWFEKEGERKKQKRRERGAENGLKIRIKSLVFLEGMNISLHVLCLSVKLRSSQNRQTYRCLGRTFTLCLMQYYKISGDLFMLKVCVEDDTQLLPINFIAM